MNQILRPSTFLSRSVFNVSPFSKAQTVVPFYDQRRGLADEKAVKNRMRSVQSIQKITKAMKMVAASKLRYDQRRRDMGLPFCRPVLDLFDRLPLESTQVDNKDVMLVCLTSDKGLCGGVNSSIAKLSRTLIRQEEAEGLRVSVIGIGEKIRAALQRVFGDRFSMIINEVAKCPLNFGVAAIIAERIAQAPAGRVSILHNKFCSIIAYDTKRTEVLSVAQAEKIKRTELDVFEFEPEASLIWKDLHEFYLACATFNCLLENAATEQSQRMSAMDNASKNAGEMLSRLTLSYNKARQMKITMELIEIISGANAL